MKITAGGGFDNSCGKCIELTEQRRQGQRDVKFFTKSRKDLACSRDRRDKAAKEGLLPREDYAQGRLFRQSLESLQDVLGPALHPPDTNVGSRRFRTLSARNE
jgi:hypothetical protein